MSSRPWRFRIGATIFLVGFASPVLIPWVVASGLSPSTKALVSGLLVAGIPEGLALVAAAVLGKDGFSRLKGALLLGLVKRRILPERVSHRRYRVGIVAFATALLVGWMSPYAEYFLPAIEANELFLAFVGDLILVSSLFLLGGEFWEKLRALFSHGARAVFPE